MNSSAMAWDFKAQRLESAPAASSGFSVNENITVGVSAKIVAVHATQTLPTVLPYNANIPIVNIQPVVTVGSRPLLVNGSPCVITIYGVDAAGNLYDISSAAWMSPPQVVQWGSITSGPPMPGNMTPAEQMAFIQDNVLDLGYSTQANAPGEIVGMSFSEQAPRKFAEYRLQYPGDLSGGNEQRVVGLELQRPFECRFGENSRHDSTHLRCVTRGPGQSPVHDEDTEYARSKPVRRELTNN